MSLKKSNRYPQPKELGGQLIRKVISQIRQAGFDLPLTSHILIGVSGGSDSLALAHLLLKYGRRVVGPTKIRLIHINHGWRHEASDADAEFVARFARKWRVPLDLYRLEPPNAQKLKGDSWEESARNARKEIFTKLAAHWGAVVLTAHQADDVAETLLWRVFTGAAGTHAGGIALQHGSELRPCLTVRKAELQAYLREERQKWREDSTNSSGRFLRSRMRIELMPVIESLFPKAVTHLTQLALQAQEDKFGEAKESGFEPLSALFAASGLKMRRANWQEIQKQAGQGRVALPGGWSLAREVSAQGRQKWVLEAPGTSSGD